MNARNRRLICLAWLALAAAPALAQPKVLDPDRRPYVPFEIDKNAAEIIKNRLKLDKDLGPLKEIMDQVLKNPNKRERRAHQKTQGHETGRETQAGLHGNTEE